MLETIVKLSLLMIFVLFLFESCLAYADKGSFVDTVKIIEYSDYYTTLQDVKKDNLDIYYSNIPSHLIDDPKSREGLHIFQSNGGQLDLLVNPAKSYVRFNPFSIKEVRFALNYLVDRQMIADEFLDGHAVPTVSPFSKFNPDYLLIQDELQLFDFRHNAGLAEDIISNALIREGAKKIENKWFYDSKPIEISIFIRTDDPDLIRKNIGETLSYDLEKIGFTVKRLYGDKISSTLTVYGSDPADLKWNIYTEGILQTDFKKYDDNALSQSYAPWFGSMPGSLNPLYVNYKNDYLDYITNKLTYGNYTSQNQRLELIKKAIDEGVRESVRIFLVAKTDNYVSSSKVTGIINDFGTGVSSRFTPINAQTGSNTLSIGVARIYQGAWNPIGGFSDKTSPPIWNVISDPGIILHPYTGSEIPIRTQWRVETAGPTGSLSVPDDAMKWDPEIQKWTRIGHGKNATSKIIFNLKFGNWHNGRPMDMNDVLYQVYFRYQWGSDKQKNYMTYDQVYSEKENKEIKKLVGVKVLDKDTIEFFVNYWHFDQAEIPRVVDFWPEMPWELFSAMEKTVTDRRAAFSNSEANHYGIDQLSLIFQKHAAMIESNLIEFKKTRYIPPALVEFESDPQYYISRYNASISFIEKHKHAIISNGPFYLESYLPEAKTITLHAFNDSTYPFEAGHWKEFEDVKPSKIQSVDIPSIISMGEDVTIPVLVNTDSVIYYYFTNATGKIILNGIGNSSADKFEIKLSHNQTLLFGRGTNNLKIFAVSENIPEPDDYETSFLAADRILHGTPTVPEFPIVSIILLASITSAMLFHKVKFRK